MRHGFWIAALFAVCVPHAGWASEGLPDGVLGSACESALDCMDGLSCVTPVGAEPGRPGPAHGICSTGCSSDQDCGPFWYGPFQAYPPVCAELAGAALCLEPCPVGALFLDVDKCHGREEMACQPSGRGVAQDGFPLGVCTPQCTLDRQCGDRFCNAALGLCVDEPVTGDAVGAGCDAEALEPTCAGYCNPAPSTDGGAGGETFTGACTQSCVVGGPIACGWSGKGTPSALCDDGGGTLVFGDLGQCVELCDCNSDCSAMGAVCAPLGSAYGHAGRCVPAGSSATQLSDCETPPEAGQCAFGAVRTCRGKGGCFGTAECLEDKSGYAACECVDESSGGTASGGADGGARGESLNSAESQGGIAANAGGVAGADGTQPNPSGKTPEPACSCSVPPVTSRFRWLILVFASGLFARSRQRRSSRRLGR